MQLEVGNVEEAMASHENGGGDNGLAMTGSAQTLDGSFTKGKKKKRKKKKVGPALTIEEAFVGVSNVQASGINPPPAKIVLTPRSAEACLKNGVNPEILHIRDLDSFWEPNIEPEVQRLRHEVYSQRRHELMRMCRQERRRLMNAEHKLGAGGGSGEVKLTAGQILEQQQQQNNTMIELEERRVEKMKRRQQKELEQLLQWEVTMKELQEENDRKMEEEARRMEKRRRERERRQRALAEERRLRELKKTAQDEAEQRQRDAIARQMHEKEVQQEEQRRQQERLAKIQARVEEEERQRRAEEHRLKTQRILEEQRARIIKQEEELAAQEAQRKANLEKKRLEDLKKKQARQAEVEERIARNLKMAQMAEEKRKTDFFTRKAAHEQKRAQALSEMDKQRELKRRERYLQERKRSMVLTQIHEAEQRVREEGKANLEKNEQFLQQLYAERERELRIMRERNNLNRQLKSENVERISRIQEYKRLDTLRKIEVADKRTDEMRRRKQEICDQRRQSAMEVKRQKESIAEIMETSKRNKKKAARMLKATMGGSKSTGKLTKSKKTTRSETARSGNPNAIAEGSLHRSGSAPLGPPPEAPTLEARLKAEGEDRPPKPFVSPYEQGVVSM